VEPRLRFGKERTRPSLDLANNNSPLHHAFQEVAARPRWSARTLAPSRSLNYKPAAYYYDLVGPLVSSLQVWETTYYHVLDSHAALIEWYRSTAMRPCLTPPQRRDGHRVSNFVSNFKWRRNGTPPGLSRLQGPCGWPEPHRLIRAPCRQNTTVGRKSRGPDKPFVIGFPIINADAELRLV
jgi:hypothetical protein